MSYRTEFSPFGVMPEAEQLVAMGFTDTSWSNDSAPTFSNARQTLSVWIEHPDPEQREEPGQPRFLVQAGDFDPKSESYAYGTGDAVNLYMGDDWQQVLQAIAKHEGAA